eukprot:TRINITY_DN10110_c0_g1_i1.p1 TRINITY_DN10110_c0_g1~~TRINITY_DN10110_c0_g1_i1.p1  ORF type:complete len:511 (-),score=58.52 TRINITY_DN10110_c0_g1_i1:92-1591(-)
MRIGTGRSAARLFRVAVRSLARRRCARTVSISCRQFSTEDQDENALAYLTPFVNEIDNELPADAKLPDVLQAVWDNETVTSQCRDFVIRLTSLRGQVSSGVWKKRGGNPNDVQILAVGTTAIPQHMPDLTAYFHEFYDRSREIQDRDTRKLTHEIGYDLLSKGSERSRRAVLTMFNRHFGFSLRTLEECIQHSAVISGGMRGLKDLADSCRIYARSNGAQHRFIHPDNSFGTWFQIVDDEYSEKITIPTSQADRLHLTAEDVHKHYKKVPPTKYESWYITPVGNPSGTRMTAEQMKDVLDAIHKWNPHALIILDVVYLRTLTSENAKQLFAGLEDMDAFQQVIVLESFSKSHGLCRERLGLYFSANEKLLSRYHAANIGFSAGPGAIKDAQLLALGTLSDKSLAAVDSLHEFWQRERKGLHSHIVSHPSFDELFDSDQSHLEGALDEALGLYLLLKTKKGVTAQEVLMKTGILGVDTKFGSGHYLRFAVGTLQRPVFST